LDLLPRVIWIIQVIFKAIIEMHFNAFIPNIKIMFAKVMAWYFVAVTTNNGFSSQRELDFVAVGEFKSSVH